MVREHVDTSLPRLVVLLDDRLAAYPDADRDRLSDSFEAACEAAASIVVAAAREELPLVLRLVSGASAGTNAGRRKDTRAYLDLLAEADLRAGEPVTRRRRDSLDIAIAVLRHRRLGDTLVYVTGAGRADDLGRVGSLRGAYPSIVAGVLGTDEPPSSTVDGLLVLAAEDGPAFARAWDGVRAW
jgi:hypothetical protein